MVYKNDNRPWLMQEKSNGNNIEIITTVFIPKYKYGGVKNLPNIAKEEFNRVLQEEIEKLKSRDYKTKDLVIGRVEDLKYYPEELPVYQATIKTDTGDIRAWFVPYPLANIAYKEQETKQKSENKARTQGIEYRLIL